MASSSAPLGLELLVPAGVAQLGIVRARSEYGLTDADLQGLPRSAHPGAGVVFSVKDLARVSCGHARACAPRRRAASSGSVRTEVRLAMEYEQDEREGTETHVRRTGGWSNDGRRACAGGYCSGSGDRSSRAAS